MRCGCGFAEDSDAVTAAGDSWEGLWAWAWERLRAHAGEEQGHRPVAEVITVDHVSVDDLVAA